MKKNIYDADNGLAFVDDNYSNDMTDRALINVSDEFCSDQNAVTRCTYLQHYTTEEVIEETAKSYDGFTREEF